MDSSLERRLLRFREGIIYDLCCKLAPPLCKAFLEGPSTRFNVFCTDSLSTVYRLCPGSLSSSHPSALSTWKRRLSTVVSTRTEVVLWRCNVQHLLSLDLVVLVKRSSSSARPSPGAPRQQNADLPRARVVVSARTGMLGTAMKKNTSARKKPSLLLSSMASSSDPRLRSHAQHKNNLGRRPLRRPRGAARGERRSGLLAYGAAVVRQVCCCARGFF